MSHVEFLDPVDLVKSQNHRILSSREISPGLISYFYAARGRTAVTLQACFWVCSWSHEFYARQHHWTNTLESTVSQTLPWVTQSSEMVLAGQES